MLMRFENCLRTGWFRLYRYVLVYFRKALCIILLYLLSVLYKIFQNIFVIWSKRGELRNGDMLSAL